jgi:hypothetical protein
VFKCDIACSVKSFKTANCLATAHASASSHITCMSAISLLVPAPSHYWPHAPNPFFIILVPEHILPPTPCSLAQWTGRIKSFLQLAALWRPFRNGTLTTYKRKPKEFSSIRSLTKSGCNSRFHDPSSSTHEAWIGAHEPGLPSQIAGPMTGVTKFRVRSICRGTQSHEIICPTSKGQVEKDKP